jgi:hypothetical protein
MKNLLRLGCAFVVLCGFTIAADGAPNAKGAAKKEHTVHGVIEHVKHEKGKGVEITLKIHHPAKKGEKGGETVEKSIEVAEGTPVELVTGKGGTSTAGSFKDLKKGEHVAVTLNGDDAKEIKIHEKAK